MKKKLTVCKWYARYLVNQDVENNGTAKKKKRVKRNTEWKKWSKKHEKVNKMGS